jgi:polyhydroxyalkanoate synthesis regulator phasin
MSIALCNKVDTLEQRLAKIEVSEHHIVVLLETVQRLERRVAELEKTCARKGVKNG